MNPQQWAKPALKWESSEMQMHPAYVQLPAWLSGQLRCIAGWEERGNHPGTCVALEISGSRGACLLHSCDWIRELFWALCVFEICIDLFYTDA